MLNGVNYKKFKKFPNGTNKKKKNYKSQLDIEYGQALSTDFSSPKKYIGDLVNISEYSNTKVTKWCVNHLESNLSICFIPGETSISKKYGCSDFEKGFCEKCSKTLIFYGINVLPIENLPEEALLEKSSQ